MKIRVNEIPPQGLSVKATIDHKKFNLDTKQINFMSPVKVDCFLTKTKEDLFAKCKITAATSQICSRCLKEFDVFIKRSVDLYYELEGQLSVELDDDIKDEIIVDYPMKILCKPDCKGLCVKCGKDLNEGECGC
ncbi:MAG: DUF177 domain-containing protein [Candidatus Omnitrophota bacterium]